MSLPKFITPNQDIMLLQTKWASAIDPVLANVLVSGRLLKSVSLANGANVINHGLSRKLTGYYVTRQRGAAAIYDTQDSNSYPDLTLQLTSNAAVVVDIYVF